jgi:hypothetical protein
LKEPVYIVDIFRDIVSEVSTALTTQLKEVNKDITGVHYLAGHHTEVKARLAGLSTTQSKKFDRYPLIALFQDFVESRANSGGYFSETTLQLMVLHHTNKDSYTEDRYNKVFKPILYPIYEELLRRIAKQPKHIATYGPNNLVHDKIDRPHWGNPDMYGPNGYILSDVLDGIEIRNLKLTFIKQVC